jgi:raffinose/stachyose/melibiose transport system substrate-binding protein
MRKSTLYLITAFLLTILMGVVLFNTIKLSDFTSEVAAAKKTKVKIAFMHWVYFPEEILTRFNQEYPNITVDFQHYNLSSYSEILQKKIAMGEKLDVIGINAFELFKYGNQNALVDLGGEKFLNNYKTEIRSEIQKINNSKEYAVSYSAEYYGIWYNKILFDKYNLMVPENYNEFLEVCETFRENDVDPVVLGARDPEAASYVYLLRIIKFMDDANWQLKLKTGETNFTKGALFNSFVETEKLIKNRYISEDSIGLTYHQAFDYFKNAKAAMLIAPDRSLNMVKEDFEKVCNPGVFIIPYADGKHESKTTANYLSALIGISKVSQNVEASGLLLEFLSRPEIADIYSRDSISYPTLLETEARDLKYNDLWKPIRNNENRGPYDRYISQEDKKTLDTNAKAFIGGLISAEDLAGVFQKIFAPGYYQ